MATIKLPAGKRAPGSAGTGTRDPRRAGPLGRSRGGPVKDAGKPSPAVKTPPAKARPPAQPSRPATDVVQPDANTRTPNPNRT